jgi:hypothetical protein
MYGTHTTMVPYMQRFIQIYSGNRRIQKVLPRGSTGPSARWG